MISLFKENKRDVCTNPSLAETLSLSEDVFRQAGCLMILYRSEDATTNIGNNDFSEWTQIVKKNVKLIRNFIILF